MITSHAKQQLHRMYLVLELYASKCGSGRHYPVSAIGTSTTSEICLGISNANKIKVLSTVSPFCKKLHESSPANFYGLIPTFSSFTQYNQNTLYCISRHSAFRSVEGICCVYWQFGLPLSPTCHNSKQKRAEKDQGNQRNMTEKQQEPHGSSKQTGHNPNTSRARELTLAPSFFTAHQWH